MRHHLIIAALAAALAGCAAGDAGPFDAEDGSDDTVVDGADGKADGM